MGIDLAFLFAVALSYLGLLFIIAWCADRGWLPAKLIRSPVVYSLSLGVYATSWTYYGSVGLAARSGCAFLNIYLGLTGAFILGPYLLRPILRLCREHQLTSIADLLAFMWRDGERHRVGDAPDEGNDAEEQFPVEPPRV